MRHVSRPSHRSWLARLVRSPGLRQDRPRPGAEHPATAADATVRGRRVAVSQCARRQDRRLRYRLRAAGFQRLVRIDGPWGAGWPPRQAGRPAGGDQVVPAQATAMRHLSHTAEPPRSWKSRPGGFMARARGPWAGRMTRANRIPPASRPERTSRRAARARVAAFRGPGRSAAAHPVRSGHAPPWADHSQSRISSPQPSPNSWMHDLSKGRDETCSGVHGPAGLGVSPNSWMPVSGCGFTICDTRHQAGTWGKCTRSCAARTVSRGRSGKHRGSRAAAQPPTARRAAWTSGAREEGDGARFDRGRGGACHHAVRARGRDPGRVPPGVRPWDRTPIC